MSLSLNLTIQIVNLSAYKGIAGNKKETMLRKVRAQFGTLEELKEFIEGKDASLKCSIQVDQWVDTIVTASKKCLVIKKTATAGAKIAIVEPGVIDVSPIAPSTFINSFRRGISAIILSLIISPIQKKVAYQVDSWIKEIEA